MTDGYPPTEGAGRTAAVLTLGCSKNDVDTEVLAGQLSDYGFQFTEDAADADLILINTCGFIEAAKQESINTILEAVELKKEAPEKKIVVWGCLAQRYMSELKDQIPEVDACFGVERFQDMMRYLADVNYRWRPESYIHRKRFGPAHTAYLKISDGCDHRCTFCAIPGIKGPCRSRSVESLAAEAKMLAAEGVRELILIGQDTTSYGSDLGGGNDLVSLLRQLVTVSGIEWIRLMYLYPGRVTDRLLRFMAAEEKICKYADIPLQHIADPVLKRMGRQSTSREIRELLEKMRSYVPGIVLRTAFIVGFPGETEAMFTELLDFVREVRFERLGAFVYSREEHTPAYDFGSKVPAATAGERLERLMTEQQLVSESINEGLTGAVLPVIIDGYDAESAVSFGRTRGDAPEVDQTVWVSGKLQAGEILKVKITGAAAYDLFGDTIT